MYILRSSHGTSWVLNVSADCRNSDLVRQCLRYDRESDWSNLGDRDDPDDVMESGNQFNH